MADKCKLCGGVTDKPPKGWKPSVQQDTWQRRKGILYPFLLVIAFAALGAAIVSARPSVIGWSQLNGTIAANWAQVFITALAGIAAGIAGLMAIHHVDQTRRTNQLSALIQVWEMVNKEEVTKSRAELYQVLTTSQRYKQPESWDVKYQVELVANPLDLTGEMVINGLLSPDVVASAYGEVFIRTYAVLQYWIPQERASHRSKAFKKGLKRIAEWAAVNDQNCRESFECGHRVQFLFRDGTKAEPVLCIWETTARMSSAAR